MNVSIIGGLPDIEDDELTRLREIKRLANVAAQIKWDGYLTWEVESYAKSGDGTSTGCLAAIELMRREEESGG